MVAEGSPESSVPEAGASAAMGVGKSSAYEKANPSALRGTSSCFSEMRDSGWKCGFRLVVGKGSEPGTGVPAPPLTFMVCNLGTSPHLILGLMPHVFHPGLTMCAAVC